MIVFEHPTRTTNLDQLKGTEIGKQLDSDPLTDWKLCTWIRPDRASGTYWLRNGRTVCEVTIKGTSSTYKFSSITKG